MMINVVMLGVWLRVVNDAETVPKIIICINASLEALELVGTQF